MQLQGPSVLGHVSRESFREASYNQHLTGMASNLRSDHSDDV